MSGETEQAVSGWTTDTLHVHLVGQVAALDRLMMRETYWLDRLVTTELALRDKALEVVATETQYAKAQANEWRGALTDLSSTKVDISTFESRMRSTDDKIDSRLGAIDDKIDLLREEVAQGRGADHGAERSRALLFAVIAAVVGLIGLGLGAVGLLVGTR